ncbi:hypothetical protein ACE6H2_017525 [Prunus campanulata]
MASYYDIDDILVEEQRVPVVFQQAVNGVDIDPSAETHCVEPGSKVELPYWLAHELHLRKVAKMKVPACFNQRTKLELGADGASVDLRSRCLYFYEFGCKIAPLYKYEFVRRRMITCNHPDFSEMFDLILEEAVKRNLTPEQMVKKGVDGVDWLLQQIAQVVPGKRRRIWPCHGSGHLWRRVSKLGCSGLIHDPSSLSLLINYFI